MTGYKPLGAPPAYLSGQVAREAQGKASSSHPDYFKPKDDALYWLALLPGHPNHPKDEKGYAVPFISVYRYYNYKTPSSDIRNNPIRSNALIEAGHDPLFIRAKRLMEAGNDEDYWAGRKLDASGRVLMNVIVMAMQEKGETSVKKGAALGELHNKIKIMEIGSTTWSNVFLPEMKQVDPVSGNTQHYDLFGQTVHDVPLIQIQKVKKGKEAYEVEWKATRTEHGYNISAAIRKGVIDITAHETTQPHTAEELKKILSLAAASDAATAPSADINFAEVDTGEFNPVGVETQEAPNPEIAPVTDLSVQQQPAVQAAIPPVAAPAAQNDEFIVNSDPAPDVNNVDAILADGEIGEGIDNIENLLKDLV